MTSKKNKLTTKETVEKCVKDFTKKSNKTLSEMRRNYDRISKACEKIAQENYTATKFMLEEFKCYGELFKHMTSTIENIDETLGNVLLAIRQNEYLQAYYPAQHEYPDLKVVGKHPVKIHKPQCEVI